MSIDTAKRECPHNGNCKLIKAGVTPNVDLPNGFNIVLDEADTTLCHVLQFKSDRYDTLVSEIKELIEKTREVGLHYGSEIALESLDCKLQKTNRG